MRKFRTAIILFIIAAGAGISLMPFIWMLVTSLSDGAAIYKLPPQFILSEYHFENYAFVFGKIPFRTYFLNSVLVSFAVTVGTLLTTIPAAFAFTYLKFKGRDFLFVVIISTMMIPSEILLAPNFVLLTRLKLINTLPALYIPWIASAFSIFKTGFDKHCTFAYHRSLPFNKGAYFMYYNEDALKEKNIAVPTTWDELREAARQLTGNGAVGLVFNKSVGIDFSFWVEQAGGHIYDEATETVLIDTPEVKEAYEFIVSMIKENIAKIEFEEGYITGPISRREAFIGFASSSNIPHIKEACKSTGVNWKVAELPRGKKAAALFSGTDITMFNTIPEETKRAAFEFMKYWFETDTQIVWGKGSGYLPLTNAASQSKEFQEFLATEDPSKQVAANMFPYAYQDPKGLNGYAIHANMQKALEEIVAGKKTIDQALKDAQMQATKEIEEAKNNFRKQ